MPTRTIRVTKPLRPIVLLLLAAISSPASGQDRTEAVFASMVAECLSPERVRLDTIRVALPASLSFAEGDVARPFVEDGRTISFAQPVDSSRFASIRFIVDEAGVEYTRKGRKRLQRAVTLRGYHVAESASQTVIGSERCTGSHVDVIRRDQVSRLENAAYPITVGEVPPASRLGRIIGPVVAGAAAAVSAYLLFSLRSESGSST